MQDKDFTLRSLADLPSTLPEEMDIDLEREKLRVYKADQLQIERLVREGKLSIEDLPEGARPISVEQLAHFKRLAALPRIISATEIMATVYPPRKWLIEGILPDEGTAILAASKAAGKTLLALDFCAAITSGAPALGRFRTTKACVLFLELELSARTVQERYLKMKADIREGLDFVFDWRRGPEGIADLEAMLSTKKYGLAVVDVAARLRGGGTDWNDYGCAYDDFAPIRETALRNGVTVLMLTHNRKGEGLDPIEAVLGSVGMAGNADVILSLDRRAKQPKGTFLVSGNDVEFQEYAIELCPEPLCFRILDEDPAEARLTPERREVLEALRGMDEAKAAEIATRIGKDADVVSKHLRALSDAGLSEVVRYGVYRAGRNGRSGRSKDESAG